MNPFQFVRSLARLLRGRPQVPESLKDNLPLQTILQRRSVRGFSRRPIPLEVFDAILEAGRLAPQHGKPAELVLWGIRCVFMAGNLSPPNSFQGSQGSDRDG